LLSTVLLSLVVTAAGIAIGLAIDWFPTQADTAATKIDTLWDVLLIASVPIFVLVMAVALYCVIVFRARPGDTGDGAPIHGNTRLEIIWVTIPFVIVTALGSYAWIVLDEIEAKEADALIVNVTSRQFAWSFSYEEGGEVKSGRLYLPKDRQAEFRVRTKDVLHSFWVPAFRLKTDAVPGLTTNIRLTPNRLGSYPIVCAELCGLGHATMRSAVRVMPPAKFDAWLAKRRKDAGSDAASATDSKG